jgi:hypothetical protein
MTNELTTDDIWLATWLVAVDVPLLRTERAYGLVRFYFDDADGEATRQAQAFRTGNPSGPVRTILNASKTIRVAVAEARGRVGVGG